MKTPVLTLLLWLTGLPLSAQTRLTGQVTLQNSGNRSAHPAQVRSFGATDTDVRTEDGIFQLVYDKKTPGNTVELAVVKPGYEVVNRKDLQCVLPANPYEQRRLKLYLCPQGQWREYADRFYQINYNAVIDTYEKAIARAKQELAEGLVTQAGYQAKLDKLSKDLDFTLKEAERLSEIFAKANLDDASERFNRAYQYFSQGLIDSVLIVLNEAEMLRDLYRVEQEIEDALQLIGLGEQMIKDGDALRSLVKKARFWKDSLEKEGLDEYCIQLRPDPTDPAGPEYPGFQSGILRIWLLQHRPALVLFDSGIECAPLNFVRRSLAGKTFSAMLDSKYWSLSNDALTLHADTLILPVRPNGSLGVLKGQVLTARTKQALDGVRVVCEGQSALTDTQGRFELYLPALRQKLSYQVQFIREGMPPVTITASADNLLLLKVTLDTP